MMTFLKKATGEELAVVRFYMEKCSLFHATFFTITFAAAAVCTVTPFIVNQPLPAKIEYPFSIEPLWIRAFLYATHVIIAFQVLGSVSITFMHVILIWFAAVRFNILCTYVKRAANRNEVKKCIREHQELLDFSSRLSLTVGRMAIGVAASNFAGVIFGGIVITYRQIYSLDFVKVILFMMIATLHLLLYAWPADYLTQLSQRVSESILYGKWIGKSPKMHRSVLIMMQRANDPAVIQVDGLLPALNLETFGAMLSTSFSYIATLLAIFDG